MKIRNNIGPKIEPLGTPRSIGNGSENEFTIFVAEAVVKQLSEQKFRVYQIEGLRKINEKHNNYVLFIDQLLPLIK